jgi:hypothetical protein
MAREPLYKPFLFYVLGSLVAAGVGAFFAAPMVVPDSPVIEMMGRFYSIFAVILVGVFMLTGDPSIIPAGGWRVAELSREVIRRRFLRFKLLFLLYMYTIAGLFIYPLVPPGGRVYALFEWGILTLAIFSFFLSLLLPRQITKVQLERIDNLIEDRSGKEKDRPSNRSL